MYYFIETHNIVGEKRGQLLLLLFYSLQSRGRQTLWPQWLSLCEAPSDVHSGLGYVTSFGQWSISKLSDASRGLMKLCTPGLVFLVPSPHLEKNVQVSRIERGPKGRPCEMSYVDRDNECCCTDDLRQQKKKDKRASWSIHRIMCYYRLLF